MDWETEARPGRPCLSRSTHGRRRWPRPAREAAGRRMKRHWGTRKYVTGPGMDLGCEWLVWANAKRGRSQFANWISSLGNWHQPMLDAGKNISAVPRDAENKDNKPRYFLKIIYRHQHSGQGTNPAPKLIWTLPLAGGRGSAGSPPSPPSVQRTQRR